MSGHTPTPEQLQRRQYAADFMAKLPDEKIDMGETYNGFTFDGPEGYRRRLTEGCGTTACLAGWCPVMFPEVVGISDSGWLTVDGDELDFDDVLVKVFGYTAGQAFYNFVVNVNSKDELRKLILTGKRNP